jgi:proteasome lid subunit RPN8/RPN11
MKQYFHNNIISKIKEHALSEFPNECLGVIHNNDYIILENIHPEPKTDFRMKHSDYEEYKDGLQAIIHSHNNFLHASKKDMEAQINSAIPWGIANVRNKNVEVFFFGDQLPTQDLLGRPFIGGVYDCYSLARDWYKVMYNVVLPNVPREWDYWSNPNGNKHFEEQMVKLFETGEFRLIDKKEIQPGDGLMFKLHNSRVLNHCAVYIGNHYMVNHMENRLSLRESVLPVVHKISVAIRPKKLEKI